MSLNLSCLSYNSFLESDGTSQTRSFYLTFELKTRTQQMRKCIVGGTILHILCLIEHS